MANLKRQRAESASPGTAQVRKSSACYRLLLLLRRILFWGGDFQHGAVDFKADSRAAPRMECHPWRLALPLWRRTLRIGLLAGVCRAQLAPHQRLLAADLGHHGVEFFRVRRDAAVCDVVAVPARCGIKRIELRQLQ